MIDGGGLRYLTRLETLDLSDVAITESVLAELTELRLEFLSLDNTSIDASGLKRLAAMPCLDTLSLQGCSIGDSAIPILKSFPKLESLFVDRGTFSDAGIQQLSPIKVW